MRNRILLAAALSSAIVALGLGGTANAVFVPSVNYIETSSLLNSISPKIAVAECPFGQLVLGGTANIQSEQGQVLVQAAFPTFDAGLAKYVFVVKAVEDQTGTLGNWSVTAGAFCTRDVVPTYVAPVSSALSSDPIKSVPVECPPNMKLVGMGGQVSTSDALPAALVGDIPSAGVVFRGFAPNDDLTKVTAYATEVKGLFGGTYAGSWKVTAVAVCAMPVYFGGLEKRSAYSTVGNDFVSSGRVDGGCSSVTKFLISAGATTSDGDLGQWYLDRFSRYNNFQKGSITVEAYRNTELGTTFAKLAAHGICIGV